MSSIEDRVCDRIQIRAEMGLDKYGVTMDRQDLSLLQWIIHTQEELMDGVVYLEKIRQALEQRESGMFPPAMEA